MTQGKCLCCGQDRPTIPLPRRDQRACVECLYGSLIPRARLARKVALSELGKAEAMLAEYEAALRAGVATTPPPLQYCVCGFSSTSSLALSSHIADEEGSGDHRPGHPTPQRLQLLEESGEFAIG